MRPLIVNAAGAEETNAALTSIYGRVSTEYAAADSSMRIERDRLGIATLDRITLDLTASFHVAGIDVLSVAWVRRGRQQVMSGGRVEGSGPGDLFIATEHPDQPYNSRSDQLDEDVLAIPRSLLDQVASTDPDTDPVQLTDTHPISPAAASQLTRARTYVHHATRQIPEHKPSQTANLLHTSLARLLAASLLATFPNTAITEPTPTDRHDGHPDTLRRAVSYIDAHAHTDINLTDIAAAAFVTARALQLAFRRHLDTTPMAYLRQVRLDHAHTELLDADPAETTVTLVATRWGFTASRFAALYRATYDQLPSNTLRDVTT